MVDLQWLGLEFRTDFGSAQGLSAPELVVQLVAYRHQLKRSEEI